MKEALALKNHEFDYLTPSIEPLPKANNMVVLISASGVGCGSTTLADEITHRLGSRAEKVLIGQRVRELTGMVDEASAQRFDKVPSVKSFDEQIYTEIPRKKHVVIEGKHATSLGPLFIPSDRATFPINLFAPDFISATRILRREGKKLVDLILNPEAIIEHLLLVRQRNEHIKEQVSNFDLFSVNQSLAINRVDTSIFSHQEIINYLFGDTTWLTEAPDWEMESLMSTVSQLRRILLHPKITKELRDIPHYENNIGNVEYNLINRLPITKNAEGLSKIRAEIRNSLQNAVFALLIQTIPRFFVKDASSRERHSLDNMSQKWTPEYYKLANIWPTLTGKLKDKSILDPFAGSGVLINILKARGIPTSVVCGDISYPGSKKHYLDDDQHWYDPKLNSLMINAIFDGLPSWYKPENTGKENLFVTLDAQKLPFQDSSFDLIMTDPPYGFNLHDGGINFFVDILPELMRVTREGGMFLIPQEWDAELRKKGINFDILVNDLSRGASKKPTILIFIPKTLK